MSNPCSEKDLINYSKSKVIEYLRMEAIAPGENRFRLWVKVNKIDKEFLLITFHKKEARIWVSLDRATAHFRKTYHYAGRLYIDL
jgi:hypothetical protein